MENTWIQSLRESEKLLHELISNNNFIKSAANLSNQIISTISENKNIFSCGNGGSHTQAMHFAEEWTGRYIKNRRPVGALCLGDASHLSCVGNDFGFEHVFSRQLEALARAGDLLLLFSTSGNSSNQMLAVKTAKKISVKTFAILGRDGGELIKHADHAIVVPSQSSARIQEIHLKILHIAIESAERKLFPELYSEL
jgi:D-sedoheptulose 7-phosphate isomerase